MATFPEIENWLAVEVRKSTIVDYEHALGREGGDGRSAALPRLKKLIADAHDDARERLRALAWDSLDPLGEKNVRDPADGYPHKLQMSTLKGYFGEVFAGLVAENLKPFGHDDWQVPAYLFRYHLVEFQQLEFLGHTREEAEPRPGRTGDDCLAFRRNDNGDIVAAMFCEAKCTKGHKSALIDEAHEKSSLPNLLPVDLLQLIWPSPRVCTRLYVTPMTVRCPAGGRSEAREPSEAEPVGGANASGAGGRYPRALWGRTVL